MTAKMIINKLGTLILIAMILGIAVGLALGVSIPDTGRLLVTSFRTTSST